MQKEGVADAHHQEEAVLAAEAVGSAAAANLEVHVDLVVEAFSGEDHTMEVITQESSSSLLMGSVDMVVNAPSVALLVMLPMLDAALKRNALHRLTGLSSFLL